jgi:hypothetical protein
VGDELLHIDPRSCRDRQRRKDAGDGGVNPGEKHRQPHAEPKQRVGERMPYPESACEKERDEKSGSHTEVQQRQIFCVEDGDDQYRDDVVNDG